MDQKYCPRCGKQINVKLAFCPFCGFKQPNSSNDNNPEVKSNENKGGLIYSFLLSWKSINQFRNRMSRSNYWWAYLANALISTFLFILLALRASVRPIISQSGGIKRPSFFIIILIYCFIATLIQINLFTATARRLHDTNSSAWYMLLSLIPIVGPIVLIIILCQKSNNENNKYPMNNPNNNPFKSIGMWASLVLIFLVYVPTFTMYFDSQASEISATSDIAQPKSHTSKNDSDTDDADTNDVDSSDQDQGDFTGPDSIKGISSDDYNDTDGNSNTFSYGELMKSDDYSGKSYILNNANVLQADEHDGTTSLLAYDNDDDDSLFMIYYADKTPAVEGNKIQVKGVLGKRQDYKTRINGSNTVPTLVAHKINVTSTSSDDDD